ncbi:hypothetical protein NEHOM01_1266 [Nematocida homosporus]|uniref:uncharacterized protein n=1 Tax=Nematocida homosporus TaxID=1912981 RepID=UPI002220559A|nr:uncharacterized protein NEHOM01_1266 [Nematocida homosporus]KAI5186084.1 hypothetical protein NEHOM01_1266 [Nematocida homosporus]
MKTRLINWLLLVALFCPAIYSTSGADPAPAYVDIDGAVPSLANLAKLGFDWAQGMNAVVTEQKEQLDVAMRELKECVLQLQSKVGRLSKADISEETTSDSTPKSNHAVDLAIAEARRMIERAYIQPNASRKGSLTEPNQQDINDNSIADHIDKTINAITKLEQTSEAFNNAILKQCQRYLGSSDLNLHDTRPYIQKSKSLSLYLLLFKNYKALDIYNVVRRMYNLFHPKYFKQIYWREDLQTQDFLNIAMMFVALEGGPNNSRLQDLNDPFSKPYKDFIENITKQIGLLAKKGNLVELAEMLELIYYNKHTAKELNLSEEEHNARFHFLNAKTIISTKPNIYLLRNSRLLRYLHPLNAELYMNNIEYDYDASESTITLSTPDQKQQYNTTEGISGSRSKFEAAFALQHLKSGYYTIKADNKRQINTFKKILAKYLPKDAMDSIIFESADTNRSNMLLSAMAWIGPVLAFVVSAAAGSILVSILPLAITTPYTPFAIIILAVLTAVLVLNVDLLQTNKSLNQDKRVMSAVLLGALFCGWLLMVAYHIVYCQLVWGYNPRELVVFGLLLISFVATSISLLAKLIAVRGQISILRHLYHLLYFLSFLLAAAVPILVLLGHTLDARLLLESHVLIAAACLLLVGVVIDVFAIPLDRASHRYTKSEKRAKYIKIFIIVLAITIPILIAIKLITSYNLLATDFTEVVGSNLNPSTLHSWLTSVKQAIGIN